MKGIKKSTRVKMVATAHKFAMWVFMAVMYWICLDFTNRCDIKNDSMYFGLCGIFFLFVCMFALLYWLLFGEEINKRIMTVYKIHRRNEYNKVLAAKKKEEDKIVEKKNAVMNKRFDEWYKDFNDTEVK